MSDFESSPSTSGSENSEKVESSPSPSGSENSEKVESSPSPSGSEKTEKVERNPSPSGSENSESEYEVEKVLGRRRRKGVLEYLIKWQGCPNSENTWEPVEKLSCPYLIRAYNNRRKKELAAKRSQKSQNCGRKRKPVGRPRKSPSKSVIKMMTHEPMVERKKKSVTFKEYLEPEEILGVTDYEEELEFHVKWKNGQGTGFMMANEAKENFPHLVISFYEKHIVFCKR